MGRKLTQEQVIQQFRVKHGNKYIYDKLLENNCLTEWGKHGASVDIIEEWLLEYNERKNRNKIPLEYNNETK